jgi:hypothetical protein
MIQRRANDYSPLQIPLPPFLDFDFIFILHISNLDIKKAAIPFELGITATNKKTDIPF